MSDRTVRYAVGLVILLAASFKANDFGIALMIAAAVLVIPTPTPRVD